MLVEAPPDPEPSLAPEPEPSEPTPYADFPHLEGAEATCGGIADCWRSPASSWRSASADLEDRLENAGYTLTNVTGEGLDVDIGVRVYTVKQEEEVLYYLNLVSVAGGVCLIHDDPRAHNVGDGECFARGLGGWVRGRGLALNGVGIR